MKHLMIVILWVLISFIYSIGLGMAFGLGAMFLGNAFIMSATGSLFSLCKLVFNWQIKWYYAGLLLAILNTTITLLLVFILSDGDDDIKSLAQMLSLFYLFASYIIYLTVEISIRWIFNNKDGV